MSTHSPVSWNGHFLEGCQLKRVYDTKNITAMSERERNVHRIACTLKLYQLYASWYLFTVHPFTDDFNNILFLSPSLSRSLYQATSEAIWFGSCLQRLKFNIRVR